ncbi:MAG: ribulose-phosphate 3-epimerase, partial [Desulfobacterales bacterium]|nr:ribulose-phosphate 3-epimerase [Desulfobacterales bacterium]
TGVALNPATPLSAIDWILEDLDIVVLMSVNPGFGGQRFIPECIKKIELLRQAIDEKGANTLIEVDGGINLDTIRAVSEAGADVFVAGSAVFGSNNYAETIDQLKSITNP